MCLYLSSKNERDQFWPSSLSSSSSFYNWLKLAQPSNLTVSLPCPGARPALLTNYHRCLRWSVTQPDSTELLSPLPFTWPINMPLRFHALVKKVCDTERRIDWKMTPSQKSPARLMTVKKQSSGSSSLGNISLYFIANAQSWHLCCVNYCYVNHLKCFDIGKAADLRCWCIR